MTTMLPYVVFGIFVLFAVIYVVFPAVDEIITFCGTRKMK